MSEHQKDQLILARGVVLRRLKKEVIIRSPGEGEHLVLPAEEEIIVSIFTEAHQPLEALKKIAETTSANITPARFREVVEMGLARGILVDVKSVFPDRPPEKTPIVVLPSVSRPILYGVGAISALICVSGLFCLFTRPIDIPDTWDRILLFWLLTCAQLTLDGLVGALVCKLLRIQVRKPDFHFQLVFFCWDFDEVDTIMAGRLGEVVCTLCRLAVSCLILTMSNVMAVPTMIPSSLVALLTEANPFGYNLVPRLVAAVFQKDRNLGLSAVTFLKKKAIGQIFEWGSSIRNQTYFLVYAAYGIVWLTHLIVVSRGVVTYFVPKLTRASIEGHSIILPAVAIVASILWVLVIIGFMIRLVVGGLARGKRALLPATESVKTEPSPYPIEQVAQFLRNTPLLSQIPDNSINTLAETVQYATVNPGKKIVVEGEMGRSLYFIYSGEVAILKENEVGDPVKVASLGAGDIFGEIALLEKVRRTASVAASEPTELYILPKQAFDDLLLAEVGANTIRRAIQVCAFLKKSSLFADWVDRELMEASAHFQGKQYTRGQQILTKGQSNDSLFLLYEGQVVVSDGDKILAELERGDFFGEISLLRSVPCTADVSAETDITVFTLLHEDFARLCLSRSTALSALQKTAEARVGKAVPEGGVAS